MDKNILDEIERLKHDYKDLKEEINELNNAIIKSEISNSRKRGVYTSAGATCEAMLKMIYHKDTNHQKPVNKLMLDELLIKVNDLLPPQVIINFRTIQAWRNYGTHDKDDMRNADSNSFIMVEMALTNIVNWFFTSYLKIDTPSENKNLINITEIDKVPQKKKINIKKKSADIYLSKKETNIPIENSKQIAPKNKSSVSKQQKKVNEIAEAIAEVEAEVTAGEWDELIEFFQDDVKLETYTYADGGKYVGEFKDDMAHGQGTYTYANGEVYEGEWKDGKRNGQGTFTWADGDKYVGEYKDDKQHGQATYTYADGGKYVGEWKDGKQHGQGTYTSADGE
jgi:hypothetical protein